MLGSRSDQRISHIEFTRHRVELDPVFHAAWDSEPRRDFSVDLVRVHTDAGYVGVGSGDPMYGLSDHSDLFLGQDPLDLERHARLIDNLSFHYGRCWPLDVALWDLAGKILGEPIWRLLGGRSQRVRAYASLASRREPGELKDSAEALLEAGFRALKLRFFHDDWRTDVAAAEIVRDAVGDGVELMVDCNQAWRMAWDPSDAWTLQKAREVACALEDLAVYWMEEPLFRGDIEGLKELRDSTSVRIAGGEMTRELHELDGFIRQGAYDVLQPDVVLIGGFSGLRGIVSRAEAAGLIFTPHTWGNGIGLLANAHLTAGCADSPFFEWPFDPPERTPATRDLGMRAPSSLDREGYFTLSDAPGLGIELDEEALRAARIQP